MLDETSLAKPPGFAGKFPPIHVKSALRWRDRCVLNPQGGLNSNKEVLRQMTRMGRLLAGCLSFLFLWSGGAWADDEEEPDYARTGAYVRGAAQIAVWNAKEGISPAAPVYWQPDFAFDAAIGWRNSARIALEAEFEWISNHEQPTDGSWLLGVNGKFFLLEDRIQPYVILGAGAMWVKVPGAAQAKGDWAFRNGVGVDFYLNNHWALTGETAFIWGVGSVWNNYFVNVSLGAMYRF